MARQFPQSQRFSGPGGALEMPSNGDVLMLLLWTAGRADSRKVLQRSDFSQCLLTERLRYAGDEVLTFQ